MTLVFFFLGSEPHYRAVRLLAIPVDHLLRLVSHRPWRLSWARYWHGFFIFFRSLVYLLGFLSSRPFGLLRFGQGHVSQLEKHEHKAELAVLGAPGGCG
jgi:hypothetical protein